MVQRTLSVDKNDIELGWREFLPVGVQGQLGADVEARRGGEKVELEVHERAAVMAKLKGRVDQDSFHST